jgi:hypothetical protein
MISGNEAIENLIVQITDEARKLKNSARRLHYYYKALTITTIILGVSAPAIVTYSGNITSDVWKILAIAITAFATASATIRSVLRYSERYSNSELTSLNLYNLKAQIEARKFEIQTVVKDELQNQKLFSLHTWANQQLFEIKKVYVDKEIAAVKQDQIVLPEAPKIQTHERKFDV